MSPEEIDELVRKLRKVYEIRPLYSGINPWLRYWPLAYLLVVLALGWFVWLVFNFD